MTTGLSGHLLPDPLTDGKLWGPGRGQGRTRTPLLWVQQRKQLLENFINTLQSLSWFSSPWGCGAASSRSFVCCYLPPGCRAGRGYSLSLPQRIDLGKRDKQEHSCEEEFRMAVLSGGKWGAGSLPEDTQGGVGAEQRL